MARRAFNRLSDPAARTVGAGLHCDGGGLYLQVTPGKEEGQFSRSWLFRYATGDIATSKTGKARKVERAMGLGSFPDVSLADARQRATDARRLREQGFDPIESRDARKAAAAATQAKTITFEKAAEKYISSHEAAWRNDTHREQWIRSIRDYANPILGHLAVRDIDTGLVMQCLAPIWAAKSVTAGRVRGRIERVLGWAKVNGFRQGENPARWHDHLDQLLASPGKIGKVEPQPALPHAHIPEFMAELHEQEGTPARALEFAILNASRSGEVRGMQWGELAGDTWIVPATRTKQNKTHRVPLSEAAIALIEHMRERRCSDYVFPGEAEGRPLAAETLRQVIQRMNDAREAQRLPRWTDPNQGGRDVVVHGFRSTFKDWASECTSFRDAISEAALGHVSAAKVKAAYERTAFEQQRRQLMELWSQHCTTAPTGAVNNVVPLRSA